MKIEAKYDEVNSTLAITYRGETRVFPVSSIYLARLGQVCADRVFAAKFRSGSKLWPASVTYWIKSGNANIQPGGFSNKGGAHIIVGWWNNDSSNNTQHNGAR